MNIVCLGDSITCNWNSPSYVNFWQQLCLQEFGPNKVNVISAGVNGETAKDGYYRVDRDVLAHQPDLVTIMFGHNEVFLHQQPSDLSTYLDKIISKLNHHQINHIWLLTPNYINNRQLDSVYQPFIVSIKQLAQDKHCLLIDFWELFKTQDLEQIYTYEFDYDGLTGPDYLHPNEVGHHFMAETLFDYLEKDIS